MKTGTEVYYLLSDQLGSTSVTTSATGTKVSELRYDAWGQVRYSDGATPTKYQYTGQYSNVSDFGLMFYNARWYDGELGRFAQADSVVPGGVQGYDRYAYVNNAPVKYTDPTGHKPCWATAHYSCDLTQEIADREYAKYKDKDRGAVAAFFAAQGFGVGRNRRGEEGAGAVAGPSLLGGGKPLFGISPPPDPYRLQRMALLGAGVFFGLSGIVITAVGVIGLGVVVAAAVGITTVLTPAALVLDVPHIGMGVILMSGVTVGGLAVTALGADLIYQAIRPEPPFSPFPWQEPGG